MFDVLVTPTRQIPRDSLHEALDGLFALGTAALHARRTSLYLRSDREAYLDLYKQSGGALVDEMARISTDATVAGFVVRTHVPLLVHDTAHYPALPLHPERYATTSFICVPIMVENDAVGALNFAERQDSQPFSDNDLQNAEMVARSIAAVLHSDLLARRQAEQGEIDAVTGLYNVQHLHKRLAQEIERAAEGETSLTLLLLAVTSYTDLATRLGVQVAGVLIRHVGEMMSQTLRQSDILTRYSHDELAVILPATPLDKARRVARTLAREVAHAKLPAHLRYDLEELHISIGIAALAAEMDANTLLEQATGALREARVQGSVVVAAGSSDDDVTDVTPRIVARPMHQQAIATALRLGIPYLADPTDAAMRSAAELLSAETARTYLCFPIAQEAGTLTLAMADPTDSGAIQAISQHTGLAVYPVASPREQILRAIATLLTDRRQQERLPVHVRLPHAEDPATFLAYIQEMAATVVSLHLSEAPIETLVTILTANTSERTRLLHALNAVPELVVHAERAGGTIVPWRSEGR